MSRLFSAVALFVSLVTYPSFAGDHRFVPDGVVSSEFDAFRDGSVPGYGYDASTGRYAVTNGLYNWHGFQDPTQADASYFVDCTANLTPHSACVNAGERILVGGVTHRASLAPYYTQNGGRVLFAWFPGKDHAIVTDDGCGTLSDGVTRAECPDPYDPATEALAHFSESGYSYSVRNFQCGARGISCEGEGHPTLDDANFNNAQPKRKGVWFLQDRGQKAKFRDGPNEDQNVGNHTMYQGLNYYLEGQDCVNSAKESMACDELISGIIGTTSERTWMGQNQSVYGASAEIDEDWDKSTQNSICISNDIGTTRANTNAVCAQDTRYRCWDTSGANGTSITRDNGGCVWDNFDIGPCVGWADQLEDDVETNQSRDLALGILYPLCNDGATQGSHCSNTISTYARVRRVEATTCGAGGEGRDVTLGTLQENYTSQNVSWPFEQDATFYGTGTNEVLAIDVSESTIGTGGIRNIGIMPATWLYRRGSDTITGTTSTVGAGTVMTIKTGSSTPVVDALIGMTLIIAEGLGDEDQKTITDNDATTITFVGNYTFADDDAFVVSDDSCLSELGESYLTDELACDTTMPIAAFGGIGGNIEHNYFAYGGGEQQSNLEGLALSVGNTWYQNTIGYQRRNTAADIMQDQLFKENLWLNGVTSDIGFNFFGSRVIIDGDIFQSYRAAVLFNHSTSPGSGNEIRNIKVLDYAGEGNNVIAVKWGQNFTVRNSYFQGTASGLAQVRSQSQPVRNIVFKDLLVDMDFTNSAMIDAYCGDASATTGLVVDNVTFQSKGDAAGIHFIVNRAETAGCNAGSWTIQNSHLVSDNAAAGIFAALASSAGCTSGSNCFPLEFTDTSLVAYPRMKGNFLNNVPVPDRDYFTVPAASAPDCDVIPSGSIVSISDDVSISSCTDAAADGQLDGGGTAMSVCVCDGDTTWSPL